MEINKTLLQKYANLIVNTGANVQKGQIVDLSCSIENHEFGEIIIEECYKAGAKFVAVNWHNDKASVLAYKYASLETLSEIKPYVKAKYDWIAENKAVRIFLDDDDPNAFASVDSKKMADSSKNIGFYVNNLFSKIEGEYQWCIAGIPSKKWAKVVFPKLSEEEAILKLWNKIFQVCRINETEDPNALWSAHNEKLKNRCKILNDYNFEYVEYKNNLGTNLTVYLVENHIWKGGSDITKQNVVYYPNMPTEECFTMPNFNKTNGTLISTMPLNYNGVTIKDIKFTFKDGKLVDFSASEGYETLKNMLEMDNNAKYLGEIAFVPYNNPIKNCNTLFYSTLYDENASCHFAFGKSYPDTMKDYDNLTKEQLKERGSNDSIIHTDFMVGSKDLSIIGHTKQGEKVVIFENGNFVF